MTYLREREMDSREAISVCQPIVTTILSVQPEITSHVKMNAPLGPSLSSDAFSNHYRIDESSPYSPLERTGFEPSVPGSRERRRDAIPKFACLTTGASGIRTGGPTLVS